MFVILIGPFCFCELIHLRWRGYSFSLMLLFGWMELMGNCFFSFLILILPWGGNTNTQQIHPHSYKQSSGSKMNKEKRGKENWASTFCSNQTRSGPGMTVTSLTFTHLPLCLSSSHLTLKLVYTSICLFIMKCAYPLTPSIPLLAIIYVRSFRTNPAGRQRQGSSG